MELYIRLIVIGLIPVALSVALYFVKKTQWFKSLPYLTSQIIIGVLFGISAILGTVLGVDVGGAAANARDAAPLCAGLLFGGPAGIISGIIGGVYRYVATFWYKKELTVTIFSISILWGAPEYSQLACSISTIVAGLFGAALRKYMFENKRPSWVFGVATAVVMEVFHMTVLFLTHLEDAEGSFRIVQICTIPMIACNVFAVTLSIILFDIFSRKKNKNRIKQKNISQQIQRWLLLVVVVAYVATTSFVYVLQTGTVERSSEKIIEISIQDIKKDILTSQNIENVASSRHVGVSGFVIIANSEKNIVSVTDEFKEDLLNKNLKDVGFENIGNYDKNTSFETDVLKTTCFCMYDIESEYYVISVLSHDEVYASRESSVYINSYMEVLVFAALFFIIYNLIKRKVVNNVRSVNDSLGKIIKGDLNEVVNVKSNAEFTSLSNDINTTVNTLKEYINEASQRIDRELQFAKNIQHSALPSVFPAYPNVKEFDIFATMYTAKEVGGDFYDFYMNGENKLFFLIADVSGKGIPAAMFMMRAKTLLKSLAESGKEISEVFSLANENLCSGNDANMFVTAWMGVLDIKTGHVDFVNAGHNPPLVYRKGEGFEYLQTKPNFILAGLDITKYKVNSIDLMPGDRIYLYTDGVTEATNKNNQLYGENRLITYLNENSDKNIEKVLLGVKESIDEFIEGAEQFDDITMLMLSYNGKHKTNSKKIELEYNADKNCFEKLRIETEKFLDKYKATKKAKTQILVALEEVFVNICSYAYNGENGKIKIVLKIKNEIVTISFIDKGVPFNPLKKKDPDTSLSAEDRKIGGLGIFMVKKTMDKVSYQNKDGQNILTIEKNIKGR